MAQEQQRSGQTGRDGKRCAALLGLTRRGRHPAGRGQRPGSTTSKATTEAQAVDAICLPSDMLQDRIWGLSCKAAQLVTSRKRVPGGLKGGLGAVASRTSPPGTDSSPVVDIEDFVVESSVGQRNGSGQASPPVQ